MAQKRFNEKTFSIEMGRTTILYIACSSVRTGYHTSQRAIGTIRYPNPGGNGWQYHREKAYSQYINRPWEAFDYENALHELARKFEKSKYYVVADTIREWSKKHAKGEAEEAEKFISDFKSEWGKARTSLRKAVAAGGPIESEEQANFALAALKMGNILNSLG
jgi:hypothetical protein